MPVRACLSVRLIQLLLAVLLGSLAPSAWAVRDCLSAIDEGYALPKRQRAASVVVLIHGLHGHSVDTWMHSPRWPWAQQVYWPCLLHSDTERFGEGNVFTASYQSVPDPLGLEPPLNLDTEASARHVVQQLRAGKVFSHAHVTLVAHSMGGLVTARMFGRSGILRPDELRRIKLIVFMATPAQPTESAAVCTRWGVNRQCEEMQSQATMDALWAEWDSVRDKPPVWCVAETDRMFIPDWKFWTWIVPIDSAHHPCRQRKSFAKAAQGHDHSQIVKPSRIGAAPHKLLALAFGLCVKPAFDGERRWLLPPVEDGDQLQSTGAQWLRTLQADLADAGLPPLHTAGLRLKALPESWRFFEPPNHLSPWLAASDYPLSRNKAEFAVTLRDHPALQGGQLLWARRVDTVRRLYQIDQGVQELVNLHPGLLPSDLLVAVSRSDGHDGSPIHLFVLRELLGLQRPVLVPVGLLAIPALPSGCPD